jgi:hypothetical protein
MYHCQPRSALTRQSARLGPNFEGPSPAARRRTASGIRRTIRPGSQRGPWSGSPAWRGCPRVTACVTMIISNSLEFPEPAGPCPGPDHHRTYYRKPSRAPGPYYGHCLLALGPSMVPAEAPQRPPTSGWLVRSGAKVQQAVPRWHRWYRHTGTFKL